MSANLLKAFQSSPLLNVIPKINTLKCKYAVYSLTLVPLCKMPQSAVAHGNQSVILLHSLKFNWLLWVITFQSNLYNVIVVELASNNPYLVASLEFPAPPKFHRGNCSTLYPS